MPRILVVDDEAVLRRTFERALRPRGFEVTAVGDPHLAYELLESVEHDLVLLDIHLPGLEGDALYLTMVRRWPALASRVVLMTGDPAALDRDWPAELRRRPVLLKPFGLDALYDAVVEALAQAEAQEPKRKRNGG
jgi:two-component system, NtrC family, response regulator GlrR